MGGKDEMKVLLALPVGLCVEVALEAENEEDVGWKDEASLVVTAADVLPKHSRIEERRLLQEGDRIVGSFGKNEHCRQRNKDMSGSPLYLPHCDMNTNKDNRTDVERARREQPKSLFLKFTSHYLNASSSTNRKMVPITALRMRCSPEEPRYPHGRRPSVTSFLERRTGSRVGE